jgi:hypothetical protein
MAFDTMPINFVSYIKDLAHFMVVNNQNLCDFAYLEGFVSIYSEVLSKMENGKWKTVLILYSLA